MMVQTAPRDSLTETATALLRELTHLIPITASTPEEAISCINNARPGSPIALILPLTAVSGPTAQESARQSWATFRRTVMQECHRAKVITTATYDIQHGKLSSHALLAAFKHLETPEPGQTILFVNLPEELDSPQEAHALAPPHPENTRQPPSRRLPPVGPLRRPARSPRLPGPLRTRPTLASPQDPQRQHPHRRW